MREKNAKIIKDVRESGCADNVHPQYREITVRRLGVQSPNMSI